MTKGLAAVMDNDVVNERGSMREAFVRDLYLHLAGQRINPHKLRHSWAVAMKADERNRDADIMHQAGWIDPKMLARYGQAVTAQRSIDAFYNHGAPGDRLG